MTILLCPQSGFEHTKYEILRSNYLKKIDKQFFMKTKANITSVRKLEHFMDPKNKECQAQYHILKYPYTKHIIRI